jgi:5-methylcytosine-specific restriction endonuclease McrA
MTTVAEAIAALQKPERPKRAESDDQAIKRFYGSWQWARLRFAFLKGKERRCQFCGATPADGAKIVVDHIEPVRLNWSRRLDPNNLRIACDTCNRGRGSPTDWRADEPSGKLPKGRALDRMQKTGERHDDDQ